MPAATYRGVVRGGKVVLLENETPLADGTEVLVTPFRAPGTPAAVLAAVESSPHVPAERVDELEQLIVAGRRPPIDNDPFAEVHGSPWPPG